MFWRVASPRSLEYSLPLQKVIDYERYLEIKPKLEDQGWQFEMFDPVSTHDFTEAEVTTLINEIEGGLIEDYGEANVHRFEVAGPYERRMPHKPTSTVIAVKPAA